MSGEVLKSIGAVAATVLVVLVLLRLLEPRFVYFPVRHPAGVWDPSELGVEAEDVRFRSADGLRLHGWWIGGGSPERSPVLLWCHGNAGNLTGRGPHAQALADRGLSVLLFDYRGYGRSVGEPDEAGIYRDAEAAYRYLVDERGIPPRRIVLLGRSLGAAPAARLATRVEHAGLLLVSPFPDAASMARRMFGGLPMGWLVRSRFPVAEWVGERRTPLLVIHGDADDVVPLELGRRVYRAASEPRRLVVLPGTGHNDVLAAGGERYLEAVRSFAYEVVEGP